MTEATGIELDEFAFIGRTFEEYCAMFDLDPAAIRNEAVLDCPSGPGSFVATAHERAVEVRGADVMYRSPAAVLHRRCREDVRTVIEQLREKRELFRWTFYEDVEDRVRYLERAAQRFAIDYPAGRRQGRYVPAALPHLPFRDDSFGLVLSAHFLFLYGDRLSHEFHLETIRELMRVAADEVRVFPTVGLDTEPYPRLPELVETLRDDGVNVTLRSVPFEFQRGASEMLVISM